MLTVRSLKVGAPLMVAFAAAALALVDPPSVWAASPTPAEPGIGDPRGGEGPSFVGDPVTAILIVLGIGIGSAVVTWAYVRQTRPKVGR